ncbi:MAG: sulfite dehydrogenase [Geminicoccaceae bacterium]
MSTKPPSPFDTGTAEPWDHVQLARRRLLTRSAAVAGGTVLAVAGARTGLATEANPDNLAPNIPEWTPYLGPGVDVEPYGTPSPFESEVVRRYVPWLTATTESSINFTPLHAMNGFVTPNGLHFERHHGGAPEIPPQDWTVMIHGLVDKAKIFNLDELKRMPSVSRFHFCECAANGGMEWRGAQLNSCQYTFGMIATALWTGVELKTLLEHVGIKPEGKWVNIEGSDSSGLHRSFPIEKILDDCILAYAQNGEAVRPGQGYPVRLVVPGWEGNMWVKWVRRIEIGDKPWMGREETSKYTDVMENGQARMFTWEQDCKSVVTSPSPEMPVNGPGIYRIKGLAWSGRGAIKRVDVSVDGGRNWTTARLHDPVLPKCMTFFEMPWEYKGGSALVMSRAIDDTGYVQPLMSDLHAVRGKNSIYHNNAIQTWLINENGSVENVRLG